MTNIFCLICLIGFSLSTFGTCVKISLSSTTALITPCGMLKFIIQFLSKIKLNYAKNRKPFTCADWGFQLPSVSHAASDSTCRLDLSTPAGLLMKLRLTTGQSVLLCWATAAAAADSPLVSDSIARQELVFWEHFYPEQKCCSTNISDMTCNLLVLESFLVTLWTSPWHSSSPRQANHRMFRLRLIYYSCRDCQWIFLIGKARIINWRNMSSEQLSIQAAEVSSSVPALTFLTLMHPI